VRAGGRHETHSNRRARQCDGELVYRFDIVNERLGDTGSEAVVLNADGSKTMYMVRLKVLDSRITEIETIRANKGEADRLWDPDGLKRAGREGGVGDHGHQTLRSRNGSPAPAQ